METKLERIARVAKEKPNEKITSLAGIINEETLMKNKQTELKNVMLMQKL